MVIRSARALSLLLVSLAAASCVNISSPLDTNVEATTLGTKVGKAHWEECLGLFAWGDAGVHAAAENGNIKVVRHLDQETFAILFFIYYRQTTVAYGD